VKQALDEFLAAKAGDRSPYELARECIAPDTDERPAEGCGAQYPAPAA